MSNRLSLFLLPISQAVPVNKIPVEKKIEKPFKLNGFPFSWASPAGTEPSIVIIPIKDKANEL